MWVPRPSVFQRVHRGATGQPLHAEHTAGLLSPNNPPLTPLCTDPPCRSLLRMHFTLGNLMSCKQSSAVKTEGYVA